MIAGLPRMAAVIALTSLWAVAAHAQSKDPVGDTDAAQPIVEPNPAALDDPWSAVEPEFPDRESRPLQRRPTDRKSPVLAGKAEPSKRPTARTLGALAGVVGLIVFLAWGYRAMASGNLSLLGKARRPGLIEVVSKTSLSARQSLCLVRIGPRLVLIGQSPETLRALDVIDDADLAAKLVGEAARKRTGSSQAEFHDCLEREARDYRTNDDAISETITPEAPRIADVRQTLTNTIRRIRRAVAQT